MLKVILVTSLVHQSYQKAYKRNYMSIHCNITKHLIGLHAHLQVKSNIFKYQTSRNHMNVTAANIGKAKNVRLW